VTNQHPITPPPELVQQWYMDATGPLYEKEIATRAAQWGADQELKACVEWLADDDDRQALQTYRRPKPPSLKEQALNGLEKVESFTLGQLEGVSVFNEYKTHVNNIRRALEQLDD